MSNKRVITVDDLKAVTDDITEKADSRFLLTSKNGTLLSSGWSKPGITLLGGAGNTGAHYEWDGTTWTKKVNYLPVLSKYSSAVVLNGEIHLLGSDQTSPTDNRKIHYKWNGSSWSSVSTLPYDFYSGAAVVYNNEIHILGSDVNGYRTKHYKFDGTSWTLVSTLPYNFSNSSAVVYNNEIHILGSYFGSSNLTKHYKWDGSSWTSVSTLPYSFYYGSAVVYNNEINILGSGDDSSNYTKHYKWDGSSWTEVSTLPYDFYMGSAVVYNNEIHILGGNMIKEAHYKWDGSSWTEVSTLPYDFYQGAAVSQSDIQQSITVQGIDSATVGQVGISLSATAEQRSACTENNVYLSGQDTNTLIFKADSAPASDIPIVLNIQG